MNRPSLRRIGIFAVFILALLLTSCRSTTAGGELSDPSQVVSAFVTAFNNLDPAGVRSLFAADATAFLPFATTGPRLQGREAIMQAIEPMFAMERQRSKHAAPYLSLVAKEVSVQRLGKDVAVLSFDVGTAQVFSRRTLVVQAVKGTWRITHLHASNVRPERSGG
jgi:uncharacterized protein (TIGR02246 family)